MFQVRKVVITLKMPIKSKGCVLDLTAGQYVTVASVGLWDEDGGNRC